MAFSRWFGPIWFGGVGGWECSHRIVLILLRRIDKLFAADIYSTCDYGMASTRVPVDIIPHSGSIVNCGDSGSLCLIFVRGFFFFFFVCFVTGHYYSQKRG